MAKFRRENGACTGRGFSNIDPEGFLAKFLSWVKRPNADAASKTFVATAASDECACVGHGYAAGDSVKLTTTDTLPAGLSLLTEYFVIWVSADIFKLATTHYNAMAGTAIDITDTGTGTHSVYAQGGGAKWYLKGDFSRCENKGFDYTAVNTTDNAMTIAGHGLCDCQRVRFETTGTLPTGISAGTTYFVIRVDADTIKIATTRKNAYDGAVRSITAQGSGTHTVIPYEFFAIVCDTSSPAVNDYNTSPSGGAPKFLQVGYRVDTAGYIYFAGLAWYDDTAKKVHGMYRNYTDAIRTYDSAEFAYDFRGGDEMMMLCSRRGTVWDNVYIDEWEGISSLVEGTDKVGVLQSAVTAGTAVTLQLGAGEAANFTVGKYYYLYDFDGHTWLEYDQVTARDLVNDTVTFGGSIGFNFPAGAILCAYAHRFYIGSGALTVAWQPYVSSMNLGYSIHDQSDSFNGPSYVRGVDSNLLGILSPDDEGYYLAMAGIITEQHRKNDSSTSTYRTEMNRAYGKSKNFIQAYGSGLAQMLDYRTMNSIDYLHYNTNTTYPWFVRHSESAV